MPSPLVHMIRTAGGAWAGGGGGRGGTVYLLQKCYVSGVEGASNHDFLPHQDPGFTTEVIKW